MAKSSQPTGLENYHFEFAEDGSHGLDLNKGIENFNHSGLKFLCGRMPHTRIGCPKNQPDKSLIAMDHPPKCIKAHDWCIIMQANRIL